MTKNELLDRIKDGEIKATVENYIAQSENTDALNEQILRIQTDKSNLELQLATLQKQVSQGIAAIKQAVLDPATPTDEAVLAIIAESTKDERQKQTDAIDDQIATLQKQKDALAS